MEYSRYSGTRIVQLDVRLIVLLLKAAREARVGQFEQRQGG